jgi:hypothetical protein
MPWFIRLPDTQATRQMKTNTMKAAPAASATGIKNEKAAKAMRILVGAVHLEGYQAARILVSDSD